MTLLRSVERRDAVATGSPTFNPFENPAVPLAAVGLDQVFAGQASDAGEVVTPERAVSVATFYRCLFLLSAVVGSCPLEVFRKKDMQEQDAPLFDEGNDETTYTPFELFQLIMVYRLVWGKSFVYKKRDSVDRIIDLKPLYPELCDIKLDRDGNKIFLVKKIRPDGTIDETSKPQVFTEWEIMHIPNMGYDGLSGLSVVQLMQQSVGTAIAADKLAAKFYSQGTQLGGIIKVKAPLRSQTQAEGIKARWMANNAGVAHAGKVAVLDAETDFQNITIPPDQLQFLESRKWQTTEIARWFGIPPHLVGDVEKSTSWGTGIEVQNLGLNTYTLSGHFTPIEQRITREVVRTRGHVARFNLNAMMRGTTQERYQALSTAVGGPWMSVNEARVSENKKPAGPEHDKILPPQGIGPQQGDTPQPKQQPQPKQPTRDALDEYEIRDAAEDVYEQQAEDYPPKAMAWMHHANWKGPVDVPLDHIEPDMKWIDKADPAHIQDFVRVAEKGHKLKPVILVKTPDDPKLQLIDGHHRYLADRELKRPVRAYIGTVGEDHGPWDTMHDEQFDS